MPNWCYTNYVIVGEKEQINALENKLNELESMEKPLIENGFGNLWCGIIVNLLGGDWNKVRCRGEILEHYIQDDGNLHVNIESAWCELVDVRMLFKKKYPKLKVYYCAEEPGMNIYQTNDELGVYFPERYVVDSEESGTEYFDNIEDAAQCIGDIIGRKLEPDIDKIWQAIEDWESEEVEEDRWIGFHEYDVIC